MKWYPFDKDKGYRQKRPPEKKLVLVRVRVPEKPSCCPSGIAVGYMKNAAGDKSSPYFVVPGIGGPVFEWCDCLPENFEWPVRDEDEMIRIAMKMRF